MIIIREQPVYILLIRANTMHRKLAAVRYVNRESKLAKWQRYVAVFEQDISIKQQQC